MLDCTAPLGCAGLISRSIAASTKPLWLRNSPYTLFRFHSTSTEVPFSNARVFSVLGMNGGDDDKRDRCALTEPFVALGFGLRLQLQRPTIRTVYTIATSKCFPHACTLSCHGCWFVGGESIVTKPGTLYTSTNGAIKVWPRLPMYDDQVLCSPNFSSIDCKLRGTYRNKRGTHSTFARCLFCSPMLDL